MHTQWHNACSISRKSRGRGQRRGQRQTRKHSCSMCRHLSTALLYAMLPCIPCCACHRHRGRSQSLPWAHICPWSWSRHGRCACTRGGECGWDRRGHAKQRRKHRRAAHNRFSRVVYVSCVCGELVCVLVLCAAQVPCVRHHCTNDLFKGLSEASLYTHTHKKKNMHRAAHTTRHEMYEHTVLMLRVTAHAPM